MKIANKLATLLASTAFFAVLNLSGAEPNKTSARPNRISVGLFQNRLDDFCCETPPTLFGVELGYDRELLATSMHSLGIRTRLRETLGSVGDTQGSIHGIELGAFGDVTVFPHVRLGASAVAGVERASLSDRGESERTEVGKTLEAELILQVDIAHGCFAIVGVGSRWSWSLNDKDRDAKTGDDGPAAQGSASRIAIGWAF